MKKITVRRLYIKSLMNVDPPKTIKDFLIYYYGLTKYNFKITEATYSNKLCNAVVRPHCPAGRMRSFDDLYRLCYTYIPSTTPEKLMHELLTLTNTYPDGINKAFFNLAYCNTMKKIRLDLATAYNGLIPMYYRDFRSLINKSQGVSKWSWGELLKMLKITNQKELNKYMKKYSK